MCQESPHTWNQVGMVEGSVGLGTFYTASIETSLAGIDQQGQGKGG